MTVLSVWEKEKAENLFPSCSRTRVWESLGPITDEQQPNTALSPPSNIDQYPVFFCLFPTHSSSHMSLSSGSRSESKGWLDKILISVWVAASGGKRFWALTPPHFLLRHSGHGWGQQQAESRWPRCHLKDHRNPRGVIQTLSPFHTCSARPAGRSGPGSMGSRVPIPKDSELLTSPGWWFPSPYILLAVPWKMCTQKPGTRRRNT